MQILLWAAVFCAATEPVVSSHFVRWSTMGIAKVSLLSCRGEECSCKIEMSHAQCSTGWVPDKQRVCGLKTQF